MRNSSQTDWNALRQLQDSEINYTDIPPLKDAFFERAELRVPAKQAPFLVRLDPDVLAWFQSHGPEYQSLINAALREHISTH